MRLRLPPPPRRMPAPVADGPVVLFLPARNEGPRVGAVVERAASTCCGRPLVVVVVDDGSGDDTRQRALVAGAKVVDGPGRGLGAAVATGLAHAVAEGAAVVAFCDADGEYDPAELDLLVRPILAGDADYVVGSRFAGDILAMQAHRRVGNIVLTLLVRWIARLPVTDGQSGYRALSRTAGTEAELAHEYNYAQVLTLDLVAKGFRYAEVPVTYEHRRSGTTFVRLPTYLRRVLPAIWRLLQRA